MAKTTEVTSFLKQALSKPILQGIFPTQGLNPCLLRCRQIFYSWSYQGSPYFLKALLNGAHLSDAAASAAAKSLQSCSTLCDPIDGSPLGSPVPGILQARTLEWGAIAFSDLSDELLSKLMIDDSSALLLLQIIRET